LTDHRGLRGAGGAWWRARTGSRRMQFTDTATTAGVHCCCCCCRSPQAWACSSTLDRPQSGSSHQWWPPTGQMEGCSAGAITFGKNPVPLQHFVHCSGHVLQHAMMWQEPWVAL
jgi:hypothetical protein